MFILALFEGALDMGYQITWVHSPQFGDGQWVSDAHNDFTLSLGGDDFDALCTLRS
jgi:hypothetical protein